MNYMSCFFISIMMFSCTYDHLSVCNTNDPSFTDCILPIIESQCQSCHSSEGGNSLHLISYSDILNSINNNSLLDRINANNGTIMPPSGKMSLHDLQLINDWVDSGKKNN